MSITPDDSFPSKIYLFLLATGFSTRFSYSIKLPPIFSSKSLPGCHGDCSALHPHLAFLFVVLRLARMVCSLPGSQLLPRQSPYGTEYWILLLSIRCWVAVCHKQKPATAQSLFLSHMLTCTSREPHTGVLVGHIYYRGRYTLFRRNMVSLGDLELSADCGMKTNK